MINIDDRVLDALNESEVYLCLQISRYMKSNRMTAWPSIETLAARCKWDERTVKRWRNSLEQKGFLEVKQTPGKAPTYRFKKAGFGVFHAMEDTPAQAENGGARNEGGTFYEGGQNVYLGGVQNMHPHPPQNLYPEVISKEVIKKLEVVREEERENAPLPPAGENFTFKAEKEKNAPPVPPPPPNSGPADYPAPPDSMDRFVDAVEAANHDKAADDAGLEYPWGNEPADYPAPPVTVTTFAPPEIVYETLPSGPTYRAEVHAPVEREMVKPAKAKPGVPQIVRDVVGYLNEKTGKAFKAETKAYQGGILARQKEGATLEEMKEVIDFKATEWGNDDKMWAYLDPVTLFRQGNFQRYLDTAKSPRPKPVAQNPSGPQPTPTRLTPSTVHTRHRTMADFL